MGNWNAKIGCNVEQPMVGGYGLEQGWATSPVGGPDLGK